MQADDDPVWKALADPVRRQILDRLRAGPQTTGALAAPFAQTRFGVMKHLDALAEAGLVTFERRGRERWNFLNAFALERATQRWLDPFQRAWAGRLAGLADFLAKENAMPDHPGSLLDIRQEVDLPASPEKVFAALTRDIGRWWTSPFRQAGADSRLELTPEIGAPMIERGADGHSVIWARVEEIAPGRKLYLSGRFAVVGAVAGRVHFDLAPQGEGGCRLTVSHQAVGAITPEAQESFVGGWRELLERRLPAHLSEAAHG